MKTESRTKTKNVGFAIMLATGKTARIRTIIDKYEDDDPEMSSEDIDYVLTEDDEDPEFIVDTWEQAALTLAINTNYRSSKTNPSHGAMSPELLRATIVYVNEKIETIKNRTVEQSLRKLPVKLENQIKHAYGIYNNLYRVVSKDLGLELGSLTVTSYSPICLWSVVEICPIDESLSNQFPDCVAIRLEPVDSQ